MGRQWPPTPGPGVNRRYPNGFVAAAEKCSEFPHRLRQALGVNGCEVPIFDQAGAEEGIAISDLRDNVTIYQLAKSHGVRPSFERHARPLGIRGLGN